jgi:alpha-beta hydrolase superfamily lysophospholipase
MQHPARRPFRRLTLPAGLVLAPLILILTACLEPGNPTAFYQPPTPLPDGLPGTLLRVAPLRTAPPGARGWRILYRSTDGTDQPIAVSGVVFVPDGTAPAEGRPVVAWAHATTGVASRCAPSLRPAALATVIPGLAAFLAAGAVVVATDYPGLGTPGPHPFLNGDSEARAVLDSVRAARQLAAAAAGARFAVWGHSQGGQAGLFVGQLAGSYAPELTLVGVATAAPATELADILRHDVETLEGRVLAALAFVALSEIDPAASLTRLAVTRVARQMRALARGCIETTLEGLAEVVGGTVLGHNFLEVAPTETEPWQSILATNTPSGSLSGVPLLIVQGERDTIVRPAVSERFAQTACRRGTPVLLRLYPGHGHTTIAHHAADDVVAWIADRFAAQPAPSSCAEIG